MSLARRERTRRLAVRCWRPRIFAAPSARPLCCTSVRYPSLRANDAVVGENGSGKSTLIKILSGIVSAEIAGNPGMERRAIPRLFPARRAGGRNCHRLPGDPDPPGNVGARQRDARSGWGRSAQNKPGARSRALCRPIARNRGHGRHHIEKLAGALSLANRQLVGVARSLLRPWRLLILDEFDLRDRYRGSRPGFRSAKEFSWRRALDPFRLPSDG